MFPTEELILLLILAPALWLWVDSLRAREAAVLAAAQACHDEGCQLLDETVSGQFPRFYRNDVGQLGLRREFAFEFSDTGNNRRKGHLVLEGRDVAFLQLLPHLFIVPGQASE